MGAAGFRRVAADRFQLAIANAVAVRRAVAGAAVKSTAVLVRLVGDGGGGKRAREA